MTGFDSLGICKELLKAVSDSGWKEPTPIQKESVPVGHEGKDLFGEAQTGTGKTGAYTLIALDRIPSGSDVPAIVVLVPTRELADQVSKEMKNLSKYTGHRIVAIYGGSSYGKQIQGLEAGCDAVVGTPGRILDLYRKDILYLDSVKCLVLDEADRMLDMGFIDDIEEIISLTPKNRQTLLFSATLDSEVRKIAKRSMKKPTEISVSHDTPATDLVKQYYIDAPRSKKSEILKEIRANGNPKMLVFCSTKLMVDNLYESLSNEGMKVGAIHGDMPQDRREKTIKGFRNNRMGILIATDVAARGLDIDDIECVVNYDAPLDPETYTHRIGRAGRAGRTGVAITFISEREDRRIPSYESFMGRKIERITRRQLPKIKVDNPELKSLHANEVVKEQPSASHKKSGTSAEKEDMAVISISIGKNEGVTRTDLVSFVSGAAGIKEDSIGRIGLSPKVSFIEVPVSKAEDVIAAINRTRFSGKNVKASYAPNKERCKDKLAKR